MIQIHRYYYSQYWTQRSPVDTYIWVITSICVIKGTEIVMSSEPPLIAPFQALSHPIRIRNSCLCFFKIVFFSRFSAKVTYVFLLSEKISLSSIFNDQNKVSSLPLLKRRATWNSNCSPFKKLTPLNVSLYPRLPSSTVHFVYSRILQQNLPPR